VVIIGLVALLTPQNAIGHELPESKGQTSKWHELR